MHEQKVENKQLPKKKKRNVSKWIALAFVLLTILWFLSGLFQGVAPNETSKTANLDQEKKKQSVQTRISRAQAYGVTQRFSGKSEAKRAATIMAETQGRVLEIAVSKGQSVEEGQLLLRLEEGSRGAQLKQAQAQLTDAQATYKATKTLVEGGFRSRNALASSEAGLSAAQAAVEQAQLEKGRVEIKAPFTGQLDALPVEVGDIAAVGGLLARVVDLSEIKIKIDVPERTIGQFKVGQKARLVLDGKSGEGEVSFVSPSADEGTRTFPVELTVTSGSKIASGRTVDVYVTLRKEEAHLLPDSLLSLNDDGEVGIKTLKKRTTVVFNPIQILGNDKKGMWVSGLPKLAEVIMVGQNYVTQGQEVIIDNLDQGPPSTSQTPQAKQAETQQETKAKAASAKAKKKAKEKQAASKEKPTEKKD